MRRISISHAAADKGLVADLNNLIEEYFQVIFGQK